MTLEKSTSTTRSATKPGGSSVAFARVRNLDEYITRHVNLQLNLGNTWEHPGFNDEVWIKIGMSNNSSLFFRFCFLVSVKRRLLELIVC